MTLRRERTSLAILLVAISVALASHPDQPIVENYVGRQIPTAMVARNLDRGTGFLHPTLDTAPFPNRFLVEPPIYALIVAWVKESIGFVSPEGGRPNFGFDWEIAGRLTSAVMTTLGAWAFYHLVRRRQGPLIALLALGSFGMMPVTLRYGRAFQPDATMLGFVLLGMAGWDAFQATGRARSAWLGGVALTLGLTIKVTSAWALIPFCLLVTRWPIAFRLIAAGTMLLPALAWYSHAWGELGHGPIDAVGTRESLASTDNAAIWFRSLSPLGWLQWATWDAILRNFCVRAFTPLGFGFVLLGWLGPSIRPWGDRLWRGWGIGCGLAIVALGPKWHHGYYWLVVAPLVAVTVGQILGSIWDHTSWPLILRAIPIASFVGLCAYQSAATYRTPPEWASIRESAARIAALVPPEAMMIAPEAVLYHADRPGFRLEFSPEAARRAAGEWGQSLTVDQATIDPLALVDFYARQDLGDPLSRYGPSHGFFIFGSAAQFVADVGSVTGDPRRTRWRAALRGRPGTTLLIDEPELILARLSDVSLPVSDEPNTSLPQP